MEKQEPPREATAPAVVPRPRITNACEACRSAKVKCQASSQLGICKRCLDSKRECVFKTGPRTRRPRQPKRPDSSTPSTPLPPAPGPSKTFTIDISMPPEEIISDTFEDLRLAHENFIGYLAPGADSAGSDDEYDYYNPDEPMAGGERDWLPSTASHAGSSVSHASSLPLGASALSTPPSSVAPSRTVGTASACPIPSSSSSSSSSRPQRTVANALGVRPQFNLDSATSLLATFRDIMLPHFPCVVLSPEATVSDLARERPFVLLAVLAVASSTRTLQGHSLYDEEFRKILGLKIVAGGERSIELLEGLIVYVAWYPYHLRPKNRQAFQYIRMAVDIIVDLELDEETDEDDLEVEPTPERMGQIRLYLATYFIVSHQATAWQRSGQLKYSEFTAKAIDIFQRHSKLAADSALAWKARLQRLVEETNELRKTKKASHQSAAQTEYQTELVLRGIESQLTEWEAKIPPDVARQPPIRITTLFTRLFFYGAPLFRFPTLKNPRVDNTSLAQGYPGQAQLLGVVPTLHAILEFFLGLPAGEINAFCGADWGSLILALVVGYRLSFPLPDFPDWDDAHARRVVRFDEYLDRLCRMGDGSDSEDIRAGLESSQPPTAALRHSMDVLSASKVVIGVVRDKYNRRVRKLDAPPPATKGIVRTMWAAATGGGGSSIPAPVPQPPVIPGTECPMLDGSAEQYYPYWDETFAANHLAPQGGFAGIDEQQQQQQQQQQYNDLWSTISMGWGGQDNIDFEVFNT